jgi:hypothetical protein
LSFSEANFDPPANFDSRCVADILALTRRLTPALLFDVGSPESFPFDHETAGSIVYNRALIDFAWHYGYQSKACRPYRA